MRKRVLPTVLIVSLLATQLSACGSGDESSPKAPRVEEDRQYYDVQMFDTGEESEIHQWATDDMIIYCDEDTLVVRELYVIGQQDGIYGYDNEPNAEDDDVSRIRRYSLAPDTFGQCTGELDLKSFYATPDSDDYMIESNVENIIWENGQLVMLVSTYNWNSMSKYLKRITVDLDSNEIIDESDDVALIFSEGGDWSTQRITYVDGSYFVPMTNWSDPIVHIYELDSDFNTVDTIEISDYNNIAMSYVYEAKPINQNLFYIRGTDYDDLERAFIYDSSTNTIQESSLLNYSQLTLWDNEGAYSTTPFGIVKTDYYTGEDTVLVNYNGCNVNRNYVRSPMLVAYQSDNKIVTANTSEKGFAYTVFTTTDTNPFEGRTGLRLAVFDTYTSAEINDAMYKFNQTNEDYYVFTDTRYIVEDYADVNNNNLYTNYRVSSEYKEAWRAAQIQVTNQMAVDIMAGDGPDIILGGYEYSQFNDSDIMVDLNDVMDLNRDDYFSAIFHTEYDGLYQIPYSVTPYGINDVGDSAQYRNSNMGVSLDDYARYVSEFCNGMDPMMLGNTRASYFLLLFNSSRSHFIQDGEVTLDNEYFRSIAEFVKDMPENRLNYDQFMNNMLDHGIMGYFSNWNADLTNGHIMMGIPTPDGAPIQLRCTQSVGITTVCPDPAVGWEFARLLFEDSNTNREVYRQNMEQTIADTNAWADAYNDPWDPDYVPPRYEDDAIDEYIAIMDAATSIYTADSNIDTIVYEEIQPYLVGDKTLDEIIPIIEDRCQTVLNERG